MIRGTSLTFSYRSGPAVIEQLDLELDEGLHMMVGPNGSGKSTLFRMLAGVEQPDKGTVTIDGHDLWEEETEARSRLVYLPEVPDVSPFARVSEILSLAARLRGVDSSRIDEIVGELALEELQQRTIKQLSLGQRRRVLVAAARLTEVTNYIFDEPLDGLDQRSRDRFVGWLDERLADGATVLASSHELAPFAERLSYVLWKHDGSWRHERAELTLDELEQRARGTGVP